MIAWREPPQHFDLCTGRASRARWATWNVSQDAPGAGRLKPSTWRGPRGRAPRASWATARSATTGWSSWRLIWISTGPGTGRGSRSLADQTVQEPVPERVLLVSRSARSLQDPREVAEGRQGDVVAGAAVRGFWPSAALHLVLAPRAAGPEAAVGRRHGDRLGHVLSKVANDDRRRACSRRTGALVVSRSASTRRSEIRRWRGRVPELDASLNADLENENRTPTNKRSPSCRGRCLIVVAAGLPRDWLEEMFVTMSNHMVVYPPCARGGGRRRGCPVTAGKARPPSRGADAEPPREQAGRPMTAGPEKACVYLRARSAG